MLMHLIKKVSQQKGGIKQRQVKYLYKGISLLFTHKNLITTTDFKI